MTEIIQHLVDAAGLASLYALLALPVALVYGIMNLVNFAHGELIMIGAYGLFIFAAITLPLAAFLALVIVVLAALAMERAAFRPVRGSSPETLLVTSFAVSFLLQNAALMIFGSRPKSVETPSLFSQTVTIGGVHIEGVTILSVGLAVICIGGLVIFMKRTAFGMAMRAAAEDFTMARLVGIRANAVISGTFAISGVGAGVAAFILVVQGGSAFATMGLTPVIIAFVATMMGGLGSFSGALIGAALLGAGTVAFDVLLPTQLRSSREAFVYGAVLVVLLIRPQGLVPARRERV
ncbi:MAG: branched-chain amino acid ABC transporter permease [Actinobacteria bacterium]|nr:branched-chain amino acid ABC transporter permease [Actinomycetota bacterium]